MTALKPRFMSFLLSAFALFLFVGCGQAPQVAQEEVSVRVFEPLTANCTDIYAHSGKMISHGAGGDGPGGGYRAQEASCNDYIVEISGSTDNLDSVLVEFGGQAYSFTVDASEATFTLRLAVSDFHLLQDMAITPMSNGVFLQPFNVTDLP